MRSLSYCFAAAIAASLLGGLADAQPITRTADVIGDAQLFGPATGQDRNELVLGNCCAGFRRSLLRFDTSAYTQQLNDPTLTLTGAQLVLPEQASRNFSPNVGGGNNNITATIDAYFLSQASGDWVVPNNLPEGVFGVSFSNRFTDPFNLDDFARDSPNGDNLQDGVGRRRFAANGALGGVANPNVGTADGNHDQPDVLFSTANTSLNPQNFASVGSTPSGSQTHTFDVTNSEEEVVIDLLSGETTSAIGVFQVLRDWETNVNAGIGIRAEAMADPTATPAVDPNNFQIFLESANATNEGDGTAFALDTFTGGEMNETVTTESGNGAGGARLLLTFDTAPWDFAGDFNDDGFVDIADYTVWRDNLGEAEGNLLGGNGTGGTVDLEDYELWLFNFGGTALPPAGPALAVPEPAAACMMVLAFLGLGASGRRARS